MARRGEPWILGISSSFHDGAACLLKGNEIRVAVREERLSRKKRDAIRHNETSLAISYCLETARIRPSQLDAIVDCTIGSPGDTGEANLRQIPILDSIGSRTLLITIPHHLGHAYAAHSTSGFRESTVVVVDGGGSFGFQLGHAERSAAIDFGPHMCEHISIYHGGLEGMRPVIKHMSMMPYLLTMGRAGMPRFASLGHMFSSAARQIFGDYNEAGKVMGLAPYGTSSIPVGEFLEFRNDRFNFFDSVPTRFPYDDRWPMRRHRYAALASSVQTALEEALKHVFSSARRALPVGNLCYTGGVALNSVANHRIAQRMGYRSVYIMPASDDAGTSIGAAYFGLSRLRKRRAKPVRAKTDSLGRLYSNSEVLSSLSRFGAAVTFTNDRTIERAAAALSKGAIVGWFQGGSEFGPRALGNRSILCDARSPSAKRRLNGRVKHREAFRPFAPAILSQFARRWLKTERCTPMMEFMLEICPFNPRLQRRIPAVVHVDGTGRVQLVTSDSEKRFQELLATFYRLTGVPILVNTSFNIMGEPIVETPDDALWCFLGTGLTHCVIGSYFVSKTLRPRSLLDLVPERIVPLRRGILKQAVRLTQHGASISRVLAPEIVRQLRLMDGRRSARTVFEICYGKQGDAIFLRQLLQLIRFSLIRIRFPGSELQEIASAGHQLS